MVLDTVQLQKQIEALGHTWLVRTPPSTEHHGLGRLPSVPEKVQEALRVGQAMLASRVRLTPPDRMRPEDAATTISVSAAVASIPKDFDWRSRGMIGPAEDQGWCGSCVSFCTTGRGCRNGLVGTGTAEPRAIRRRPALLLVARSELRRLERGRRVRDRSSRAAWCRKTCCRT